MSSTQSNKLMRPALLPVWSSVGLLWLLHWLPLPLQAAIGNALGWLLAQLPGKRRHVVATNLALCFPDTPKRERDRWLRQTYQASMRAVLEHGLLWWGSEARLRRLVRIDNPDAVLGDGKRPVIWLAPHFVGLDMGGVRLSMDRQVASMYAPSKNPASDWLMLRGRSRFHAPVQAPQVPMLVLVSRQDKLVDPACSLRLAQEWQVPVAIHPDAGHDLPFDDAGWVAEQVQKWIAILPPYSLLEGDAYGKCDFV